MDHISNDDLSSGRPRKRQRVSRACDPCRTRKTACDGRRPVCMACQSRDAGGACRWTFVPKREVEGRRGSSLNGSRNTRSSQWGADAESASFNGLSRARSRSPVGREPGARRTSDIPRQDSEDTPLEEALLSAQSDGLATFPGNTDQAAYGPSSTIAFLRHVMARGSRPGSVTPNGHHAKRGRSMATVPPRPAPLRPVESDQAVLPLRKNADDFLACYWEFVHPIFPLLHKTSFMDQYERLGSSKANDTAKHDDIEEPVFMSILNLLFALGCKFSSLVPSGQKSSTADEFYLKTRTLSEFLVLDSTTVATVQLLALSGVYLQSTQYATRCWNSVGLAIRAAQSLGLHSEAKGTRVGSQVDREMRRRIWHTCVSLDRLLSMTFGRPLMIHTPNDVPLPSMIDDEYLSYSHEGKQPSHLSSRLSAFVWCCKLFDILESVLSFLSNPALQNITKNKDSSQPGDVLLQVLELNRELDKFADSLPSFLKMEESTSSFTMANDTHIDLQQRVLYCRLMLVRLNLLRPLLMMSARMQQSSTTQTSDDSTPLSMDADLARSGCNICLATAYRLVDVTYHSLNTPYRSAGWHAVYFTLLAAIVLLASLKCPLIDMQSHDEKFETCWDRSMAVFEHYRDQIHSATHATLVLKAIRTQIDHGNEIITAATPNRPKDPTTPAHAAAATPNHEPTWPEFSFDSFDPFGLDNMSDAWFGQQLASLDWLELPEL